MHLPRGAALYLNRVRRRIYRTDIAAGPNGHLDRDVIQRFGREFFGIERVGVADQAPVAAQHFVVGQFDAALASG